MVHLNDFNAERDDCSVHILADVQSLQKYYSIIS